MSEEIRPGIQAFHVNDKARCDRFLEDESYLIISNDRYWLGNGMYFWDNNENADYWLNEKIRKDNTKEYKVVKAIVYTDDEMLDLTTNESQGLVNLLWDKYCEKTGEEKRKPLGEKLNMLIKFFNILSTTKIIKGVGDYNLDNKKSDCLKNSNKFTGPQIRSYIKIIYCVRDPSIVISRRER